MTVIKKKRKGTVCQVTYFFCFYIQVAIIEYPTIHPNFLVINSQQKMEGFKKKKKEEKTW